MTDTPHQTGPQDDRGRYVSVGPSSWGPGVDIEVGTVMNRSAIRLTAEQLDELRALLATLPREDADLDAIEETLRSYDALCAEPDTRAAHDARVDAALDLIEPLRSLLARVRTAEAESHRLGLLLASTEAEYEDVAARTVETAEEWEYGRPWVPTPVPTEGPTHRRRPARRAGPWEPVPPTPEDGDRG